MALFIFSFYLRLHFLNVHVAAKHFQISLHYIESRDTVLNPAFSRANWAHLRLLALSLSVQINVLGLDPGRCLD